LVLNLLRNISKVLKENMSLSKGQLVNY